MVSVSTLSTRARVRALGLLLAAAPLAARPLRALAQSDVAPARFSGPVTFICGGLDSRTPDEPENTDVLMLARVDLRAGTVRAISIPRDLYLEIPGYGYDKITRAYDFGSKADGGSFKAGAALVAQTVLSNFGVEADGVLLTTFTGFSEIVDALNGITVDNPYDVYDAEFPTPDYGTKEIFYPAGTNQLNGEQALEFARTRHQDGDDGRVMRQQLVLRALLDRASDAQISPDLPALVEAHKKAVRTDLGPSKRLALALAAPSFTNDGVAFGTLNGLIYADTAPNGMWIYSGDWGQIPGYVEAFLAGQVE